MVIQFGLSTIPFFPILQKPTSSRSLKRPRSSSGDGNNDPSQNDDKYSTDWDKAWKNLKKKNKKPMFPWFASNKYVSYNPRRSEYPLTEEIDPIKRTEKSTLRIWTSSGFTLVGAIILITFLIIYVVQSPIK